MVHLLDTTAAPFLWWVSYVIFLKPIPNGKVIEYVKEKNETEVDISFLLATLGIALLLMVAFAAVTGHNWRSYVLKPERTDCNPFHSTSDMLSFTALEARGGNERRFIEQGGIFVFLSQDYLHIKPDLEGDKFVP